LGRILKMQAPGPGKYPEKNPQSLAFAFGALTGLPAGNDPGLHCPMSKAPPARYISRPTQRPNVPDPMSIGQALAGHEALARLGRLMQESNRRMAIIAPALPGAMTRFVKAGPIDDEAWSLLAANAAVAAKLRHLQPRLEAMLRAQGLQPSAVRIKVQQT